MVDDHAFKDPHRENLIFIRRILIAALVVMVMAIALLWRYYQLQVVRYEDFKTRSDSNRLLVRPVPPPRGLIVDRNGVLLADNLPSFNLTLVKELSKDLDALITELSTLIVITDDDIEQFHKLLVQRRRPFEPVPLRYNLTQEELGILAVNEYHLPAVQVSAEQLRAYPQGAELAHTVGYVGRINDREAAELDAGRYAGTHVIGKTGLEKYYEDRLLGQNGYETVEVNARGKVMRQIERVEPVPGQDLQLYLDIRLQQLANSLLQGERGAIVMIELATGGVLAMASAPTFDPNLFVTGISHKDYNALLHSPARPLYDRVLQGLYPPGSTVKPMYGLAFLDSGAATSDYRVFDPGFFQLEKGGRRFRDWKKGGHGWSDLHKAIVQSCDVYFYDVGIKAGIDTLQKYAEQFGLGEKSGIDMPHERSGIMPSRDWKRGAKGESWYPGDTVNTSIGQGYMLTSPMQLAVMTSRMATHGEYVVPRLAMPEGEQAQNSQNRDTMQIAPQHWTPVFAAMEDVVHGERGTAKGINKGLNYRIAGKTGTAQVVSISQAEEYDEKELDKLQWDHALFVAFAPADNPRVAISIIVENGQHGSSTAAPIARKMFDAYLEYYPAAADASQPDASLAGKQL